MNFLNQIITNSHSQNKAFQGQFIFIDFNDNNPDSIYFLLKNRKHFVMKSVKTLFLASKYLKWLQEP